jgi:hypothetical protein
MKKLILLVLFCFNIHGVYAAQIGKVVEYSSTPAGTMWFLLSGNARDNRPNCVTKEHWRMGRDDKENIAIILAALAANKTVRVAGKGTCNDYNDVEDIYWITIYNQ